MSQTQIRPSPMPPLEERAHDSDTTLVVVLVLFLANPLPRKPQRKAHSFDGVL